MLSRNIFWALSAPLLVAYMVAGKVVFAQSPAPPLAVPAAASPAAQAGDADGDDWTAQEGDCNDANASVNPEATEICGNSIDDNCDGEVDEPGVCGGSVVLSYNPRNACTSEGFTDIMSEIPNPVVMVKPGHWEVQGGFSTEFRSYDACPPSKQLELANVRAANAVGLLGQAGWTSLRVIDSAPGIAGVVVKFIPDPIVPLNGRNGAQGPQGSPAKVSAYAGVYAQAGGLGLNTGIATGFWWQGGGQLAFEPRLYLGVRPFAKGKEAHGDVKGTDLGFEIGPTFSFKRDGKPMRFHAGFGWYAAGIRYVPTTTDVRGGFEAQEGRQAFLFHPELQFGDTSGLVVFIGGQFGASPTYGFRDAFIGGLGYAF